LPEIDPLDYDSPQALVAALRYAEHDRWSRVSDRAKTDALFQEGKIIGLGFKSKRDADGALRIAFVHPGSPAEQAGMRRGDELAAVGGLTIAEIEQDDRWDDVYGADEPGVQVEIRVVSTEGERELIMTKDWFAMTTVPSVEVLDLDGRPVGYLLFSTFVKTSSAELDAAFEQFSAAGVREVVIDMRYNGGGLISIARHLMNLLVGDVADGDVAYKKRYGPGLSDQDTSTKLSRQAASLEAVERVVFITSGSTFSASELVINAVRPHVQVLIVGDRSGGKPVGSLHWNFCDQVAAPITFRLLNADDEGDYFEGLGTDCFAPDDLGFAFGDPREASLSQALHLLQAGTCAALEDDPAEDAHSEGFRLDLAPTPPRAPDREGPSLHGLDELRGFL
jgi:C-terminal processing protease CtpA/Prc